MSLAVRIDADDPTPPYEQLRRQIGTLVETGVLPTGTRLPSVRQLAADLLVAPGTVARTYRELEASGLLRSRRGAGTTVTAPSPAQSGRARRLAVDRLVDEAVTRARALGASDDDVREAVARALGTPGASG